MITYLLKIIWIIFSTIHPRRLHQPGFLVENSVVENSVKNKIKILR